MKLFLTIFIAVLLANLAETAITAGLKAYTAKILLDETADIARHKTDEIKQQAEIWKRRNAEQVAANKIESERQQQLAESQEEIDRTNRRVCDFWKKQYRETGESYDKNMMTTACKHSGQL